MALFGTDGIRGIANTGSITPEVALKLGSAAGTIFTRGSHRHLVVIGKDTRLSGYLLEHALISGFISVGMDVLLVGPMPTPAIAMLTKSLRADIGIMISASHNPFQYNGIKIFDHNGIKLDFEPEQNIEKLIINYPQNIAFAEPQKLGKATRLDDAQGRYIEYAKNTFPKSKTLDGIKVVIDSANGAAYHVAHKIFWELGAEVVNIGNNPDGFNINKNCGSTHPEYLRASVMDHKADIGIALDGDADRVILVDEKGDVIDGDKILSTIAVYMKSIGQLNHDTVVTTYMSNVAFEHYLAEHDIKLLRTDIGDKYVSKLMRDNDYNLGGEQSGHVILSEFSSTGDGIVAALQILANFVTSQCTTISELCHRYEPVHQSLYNIKYNSENTNILENSKIKEIIKNYKSKLDKNSRLLVRKSGTEPVIRTMIESADLSIHKEVICELQNALEKL